MINNVIIAGSILMFTVVFITTFDYGHLLPVALDEHVCMVSDLLIYSLQYLSSDMLKMTISVWSVVYYRQLLSTLFGCNQLLLETSDKRIFTLMSLPIKPLLGVAEDMVWWSMNPYFIITV